MPNFNFLPDAIHTSTPCHKGRLIGQKPPLKPKEVWAIRIRLQIHGNMRDLALFNLAIDSKLRSCDLVSSPPGPVRVGLQIICYYMGLFQIFLLLIVFVQTTR